MISRKNLLIKFYFIAFLFSLNNSCDKNDNENEEISTSQLVVSPANLNLSSNQSETFFLSAQPKGQFQWNISSKPDWISVNPSSGTIGDDLIEISVTSDSEGMAPNTYYGEIEFVSNGAGKVVVKVQFNVQDPSSSLLTVSQSALDFKFSEETKDFYIKNEGEIDFDWSIENQYIYLTISPESGFLIAGDSVKVTAMVNRATLHTDMYEWPIVISNNQNNSVNLPILVNSFVEEKWMLGTGEIIDAEYDRNFDRLIGVTAGPNQIRKYDPVSRTTETFDLNLPPTCISISQDGNYAAVGHDGKISHVNLSTMQLVDILDVTTDVFDIILAPNNWVYAFPRIDQWERIRCINLETKVETMHIGNSIRAGTKVKLHPSGEFIYGADNGLSPSDFEKYDITMGTAQYLYDSPYHGDFSFDGNIWISENGEKLFARSRNIFNATTSQSTDMTYQGKFIGEREERIAALDHHEGANVVYTVYESGYNWQSNPSNIVKKYSADFYNFLGEEELPKFLGIDSNGNEKLFDSKGYYGFFNSSGTNYHVVLKATEEDNTSVRWAIATLSVD